MESATGSGRRRDAAAGHALAHIAHDWLVIQSHTATLGSTICRTKYPADRRIGQRNGYPISRGRHGSYSIQVRCGNEIARTLPVGLDSANVWWSTSDRREAQGGRSMLTEPSPPQRHQRSGVALSGPRVLVDVEQLARRLHGGCRTRLIVLYKQLDLAPAQHTTRGVDLIRGKLGPPRTLGSDGCSILSRSRSAHSASILVCILARSSSAEAVDIPAHCRRISFR
jgi:hypothetical protein